MEFQELMDKVKAGEAFDEPIDNDVLKEIFLKAGKTILCFGYDYRAERLCVIFGENSTRMDIFEEQDYYWFAKSFGVETESRSLKHVTKKVLTKLMSEAEMSLFITEFKNLDVNRMRIANEEDIANVYK